VTKLFGYDYEIIYNKGKENVVVDALSQQYEEETLFSLSFIVTDCLQVVRQKWWKDPKLSILIQKLQQDPQASPRYSWHNKELRYKIRMYLSKQSTLALHVFTKTFVL
jgi:hypothetical protein